MGTIYLLNLGFSSDTQSLQTGTFTPPPLTAPQTDYLAYSQVWLKLKSTATPPAWAAVPGVNLINVPLNPFDWDYVSTSKESALGSGPASPVGAGDDGDAVLHDRANGWSDWRGLALQHGIRARASRTAGAASRVPAVSLAASEPAWNAPIRGGYRFCQELCQLAVSD